MSYKGHLIKRYSYSFDTRFGGPASLLLLDDTKVIGTFYFLPDGAALPAPVVNSTLDTATAYFRSSALSAMVEMLRTESPIRLGLADSPPSATLGCGALEPIGVEDESRSGLGYMP